VRYEYSTAIKTDNERLVDEVKKRSILYEQTSNSYKEAKRKDTAQQEIAQELDCDGSNRYVCLFFVYGLVHKWHPCWLVKGAKAIAGSQRAVQSMTSAMGCRWGQSM
jgi:thiol:disulfide interchange protein